MRCIYTYAYTSSILSPPLLPLSMKATLNGAPLFIAQFQFSRHGLQLEMRWCFSQNSSATGASNVSSCRSRNYGVCKTTNLSWNLHVSSVGFGWGCVRDKCAILVRRNECDRVCNTDNMMYTRPGTGLPALSVVIPSHASHTPRRLLPEVKWIRYKTTWQFTKPELSSIIFCREFHEIPFLFFQKLPFSRWTINININSRKCLTFSWQPLGLLLKVKLLVGYM